jgi:glycosyltransferase involved in cell wall biosynthesis
MGTAESLLLGVPVFGYAQGATPSLVGEASGILVPQKDIATLKEAFTRFAQTSWDRQRIAKRARKRFIS